MERKVSFFQEPNFLDENIKQYGVVIFSPFRKISSLFKPFRILSLRYNLFFPSIWYTDFENVIVKSDLIVLPASNFSPRIAKYIDEKISDDRTRLIYWYWDSVRPAFSPLRISDRWEKWSFDKADCRRFSLKYNSTYYFKSIQLKKVAIKYDIMFVGQNKGRLSALLRLNKIFTNLGLSFYLHVVKDNELFNEKYAYKNRISYKNLLSLISQSVAILDLMQDSQSGLTLRVMESIFLEKKLITNNLSIVNYKFYRRENIFILGHDSQERLNDFIQTPYLKIEEEIVRQYEFAQWLQRIVQNTILKDEVEEGFSN